MHFFAPQVFSLQRCIKRLRKFSSCYYSEQELLPTNHLMQRKQQGFFLCTHFMFCPLLWPSQLQTEPLRTQKAQDPRPQDIKTFLCTDCLLTITSLSQLSINSTNQSLAWELLIRDAHPQMHSFAAWNNTTDSSFNTATDSSKPVSIPCLITARDWMGHTKRFPLALCHTAGATVYSPFNSIPNYHSYGDNCLITRCTHCHSDLCPTAMMCCDQVEKSKGLLPYRFPSTYILYPLAIAHHKWLFKIWVLSIVHLVQYPSVISASPWFTDKGWLHSSPCQYKAGFHARVQFWSECSSATVQDSGITVRTGSWFGFNEFQKNSVIILKSAKNNLSQGRDVPKPHQIPWTFSSWIRNCSRWAQKSFLILAINKCKRSQWQTQCIFSLYWDISLVSSALLTNFLLWLKPTIFWLWGWCLLKYTHSQALSSLMFLFQSKVCKHLHQSDYLQGVSIHVSSLLSQHPGVLL